MTSAKGVPSVSVRYAQTGRTTRSNEFGSGKAIEEYRGGPFRFQST